MKKLLIVTIVLAALLSFVPSSSAWCWPCVPPRSQGYWKNHPEAWPVSKIYIGGYWFTREEAIKLMQTPVKGDKRYTMFQAVVAATLNVFNHACTCPEFWRWYWEGQQWMSDWGPVTSGVKASSEAWQYSHGELIYLKLDAYNNGYLCP